MSGTMASREAVLAAYEDGVAAVAALGESFAADPACWAIRACGDWDAATVARHLAGVIGWYHAWLDRAEAGDAAAPFATGDLPTQNDAALAGLGGVEPAAACARFVSEARRYASRLALQWDLPYGYPGGTLTAGLHGGIAAVEWHLHAWDLAGALGRDHVPADSEVLLLAATGCRAVAPGGWRRRLEARLAPLVARRDPWSTLLKASGRAPSPRQAEPEDRRR